MECDSAVELETNLVPTIIAYLIYGVNVLFLFSFVKSLNIDPNSMNDDCKSNSEMIIGYIQSKGLRLTELWHHFGSRYNYVRHSLTILNKNFCSTVSNIIYSLFEIGLISLKELGGFLFHFILVFIGRDEQFGAMKSVTEILPNHSKVSSLYSSARVSSSSPSHGVHSSALFESDEGQPSTSFGDRVIGASPDTVVSHVLNQSCAIDEITPFKTPLIIHPPKKRHMFAFGFNNRKKSYSSEDTESVTTRGSFKVPADISPSTPQSPDESVISRSSMKSMASHESDSKSSRSWSVRRHAPLGNSPQQSHSSCTPAGSCLLM